MLAADTIHVNRLQLPRGPEAGGLARSFLDERFGSAFAPEALVHAKLVVSELVNNAVVHGSGEISLSAVPVAGGMRVEVVDQGTGNAPAIREQAQHDGGGWGLRIVETLARRWGAFEGTTHVWAELPLT